MIKKLSSVFLIGAFALSTLAACQSDADAVSSVVSLAVAADASNEAVVNTAFASEPVVESDAPDTSGSVSVAVALAENSQPHATVAADAAESVAVVEIALHGDSIAVDGEGVAVDGSTATITSAGTYRLSGSLTDGKIVVDIANEDSPVRLILDNAQIRSASSGAIVVVNAEEVEIVLADGTQNTVADGATASATDPAGDEPNAAIFSASDLTISGSGSLTVEGSYNDGIASKDGLVIASGTITVSAADDGIRGKDYLVIEDGALTVDAQGDGLKSDNEEDATKGYVAIENGAFDITAGGDAITAASDVLIGDGEFSLTSGGGSSSPLDESISAKGIKATVSVVVDGGAFAIDSADDAINANDSLTINGGVFTIATGDDALHADASLTINAGEIAITTSYEGIESTVITINGGAIDLVSSDDGINVAGGNDGSGMMPGGRPGQGGPRQDAFANTSNQSLAIHGGTIVVDADGDGLDANGAVEMTGGLVIVNGPIENMNGALDYDAGFAITGGTLVAAGSAGMAQAPDASSSQYSLLINFPSALPAGTLIHIRTSDGEELMTFAPLKQFQSIALSSPALEDGSDIVVYYEGSSTGTAIAGFYQGGAYTPGEEIASFTISDVVTMVGNSYGR